jgi:hypothetical protein
MTSANMKKNILNIIPTDINISENIFFILFIFSMSHFPWSSETTGKMRVKIGAIIIKGMPMILK